MSRPSGRRLQRPEQPFPAREECAGAPQDSTTQESFKVWDETLPKDSPVLKTEGLDSVFIVAPIHDHSHSREDMGSVFGRTDGNRLHFRYGDPFDSRPCYSDDEDLEGEQEEFDEKFTRSCIAALSNLIARRVSRAMIDLVGIEPNPGPVTGKNLTNLVNNLLGSGKGQSKQGKRKKSKPQKGVRQQSSGASPANNMRMSQVPAGFGFVIPQSYYKLGGSAQREAMQDWKNSVRYHGCALMPIPVAALGSIPSAIWTGALASINNPDNGYLAITPTTIDPRLQAVSSTFQYYAFRSIRLRYIPSVGTSNNGDVYLAISKDPEMAQLLFNVATPGATGYNPSCTPQAVLEHDPSLMTTIWQPAMLDFVHRGVELWETYPNGEEPTNARIQASIIAMADTIPVSTTQPTSCGKLWIEYTIDFYVPGPPSLQGNGSGPNLFKYLPNQTGLSAPTTGVNIGQIDPDEVPTGMVFFSGEVSSTNATTLQLQSVNTATGTVTNLGAPVNVPAGGSITTQYVIPFILSAAGAAAAITGAGALTLRLVPGIATIINLANLMVKSS